MLAGEACEPASEHALKVGNELAVVARDPVEKGEEAWAASSRPDGCRNLRHEIFGPMLARVAGSKINHAVGPC